jgi:F-type H+-transporting ATPase subunit gamma
MATVKLLRNRIKSVQSTQKITTAMKLVSASKLRRAQEQLLSMQEYHKAFQKLWKTLCVYDKAFLELPSYFKSEGKTKLLIFITSDRGLCGGFNSNIVRHIKHQIQEETQNGFDVKLLPLGIKGVDQLKRDYGHLFVSLLVNSRDESLSTEQKSGRVIEFLMNHLKETSYHSIEIVSTHFKSIIQQDIKTTKVFPLNLMDDQEYPTQENYPPIFEPDQNTLFERLLYFYLSDKIRFAYFQSETAEQASRMRAMDAATNNAKDVILLLTRLYNRTRQANITRELIEIISGANAINA